MEVEVCTPSNRTLCKVHVNSSAAVKDVKQKIFAATTIKVSRQSVRSEPRGKDLKDETPLASLGIKNGSRIYVKDLGPQISWSLVFVLEYLGPLLVYLLVYMKPYYFYNAALVDKKVSQYDHINIPLVLWSFHYSKRVLETLFVHRFSHGTMPLRNLFKNCGYYWGFAFYIAYHVNHPLYTKPSQPFMLVGLAMFVICELGNLSIHLLLRNLRPPGSKVRKIPAPNSNVLTKLFNYVSCPNYTYEVGAWIGFSILTSCLPALLFTFAGFYQMALWALGKHKNYLKEFPDYPRKRKAIVPFLL